MNHGSLGVFWYVIESFIVSLSRRCGPRFTQLFSAVSVNLTRDTPQLSPGENAPGIASVHQLRCSQILFTGLLALFETRAGVVGLDLMDYSPSVNGVKMHSMQLSQSEAAFPTCSVTVANQMQANLHMGGRVWACFSHIVYCLGILWQFCGQMNVWSSVERVGRKTFLYE